MTAWPCSLRFAGHFTSSLHWTGHQNRPTKLFFETANRLARWPTVLRGDALLITPTLAEAYSRRRDVIRYQRKAMRQSVDLLMQGRLLVIFPEGYPNIDPTYTTKTEPDEFLPFKPGFSNIVSVAEKRLNQKIPIIPAGFHYTRGSPWIGHLRFGAPIYRDNSAEKEVLIRNTEKAVKDLSL